MSEVIDLDDYIEMWNEHLLGSEGVQDLVNALIVEVKQLREENDALSEAIGKCVITQMNSAEHGARYQSGGCFEHYSYWKHEKDEEE